MPPRSSHKATLAAILSLAPWLLVLVGCEQGHSDQRSSRTGKAGGPKLPTLAIADDSPRTYLERAIAAYGGAQNIERLQIGRVEMVGRGSFAPGLRGQFTMVDTFHLPQRMRRETSFSDGKIAMKSLTVIDGDRAWTKTFNATGDTVREIPPPSDKNNAFPHSVLGALIEMCDPAVRLTQVASDQPGFTWIAVERDGQPIGTNVFENKSHHIVGNIKQLSDPAAGAIAVRTVYSGYQPVAGIDVPMQLASYRESDPMLELKVIKLEVLQSVDERLFAKPE